MTKYKRYIKSQNDRCGRSSSFIIPVVWLLNGSLLPHYQPFIITSGNIDQLLSAHLYEPLIDEVIQPIREQKLRCINEQPQKLTAS